jgi:hypothetical protein
MIGGVSWWGWQREQEVRGRMAMGREFGSPPPLGVFRGLGHALARRIQALARRIGGR